MLFKTPSPGEVSIRILAQGFRWFSLVALTSLLTCICAWIVLVLVERFTQDIFCILIEVAFCTLSSHLFGVTLCHCCLDFRIAPRVGCDLLSLHWSLSSCPAPVIKTEEMEVNIVLLICPTRKKFQLHTLADRSNGVRPCSSHVESWCAWEEARVWANLRDQYHHN